MSICLDCGGSECICRMKRELDDAIDQLNDERRAKKLDMENESKRSKISTQHTIRIEDDEWSVWSVHAEHRGSDVASLLRALMREDIERARTPLVVLASIEEE